MNAYPMKTEHGIRGLTVALLLALAPWSARATSFSADFVDTQGGQTQTTPFSYHDKSYRFEAVEDGQTVIVTGDGASGIVRMLVPTEKLYLQAGPDEPTSRMLSPFAFFAYYARTRGVRTEGTEVITGVTCTKQVAFGGGQDFATAWISKEHGFPLKIEVPLFGRTVELRNLRAGPQDPALFALPAGYQPAPPPGERPPTEWIAQVSRAPVLQPPFEQAFAAGKIIRLRPQSGRHIQLTVTNPAQAPGTFTSVAFKGGRPLSDPSGETVTLDAENVVNVTHSKSPTEADEIVVRVQNGTVKIKAEFVPAAAAPLAKPGASESVADTAATDLSASIEAPRSADIASRFEVSWSGPAAKDDYLTIARLDHPAGRYVNLTRVREGNPLKLWAPSDPGEYEVRYILARGTKVLARAPITINAVNASVEASGPVKVADWIEVKWEGPSAEGDTLNVARPDQAPGSFVERTAVKQGNPVRVRAPSAPGEYEVRYILGRGTKLLAKTAVTIEDVTATVEAPAEAKAGAEFEVRWTGPGYQEDAVVIARPDQAGGANVGSKATRTGNPLKLRAPKESGTYEVRYLLGRGKRPLAKTTVTITPTPAP